MQVNDVITRLKEEADPSRVPGMAKYGINPDSALGISIPALRKLAKEIGTDHALAPQLWASGLHEARILATMIDDPGQVTQAQMEAWVQDFNSWDLCDQCCSNLFDKTPWAVEKAITWTERDETFVKRAGFVLMATLAVHDKQATDDTFTQFFPLIKREAHDNRNFVKKAVNWALRQIGKRNLALNAQAIAVAEELTAREDKAARWIGSDAVRELTSDKVQARLHR